MRFLQTQDWRAQQSVLSWMRVVRLRDAFETNDGFGVASARQRVYKS